MRDRTNLIRNQVLRMVNLNKKPSEIFRNLSIVNPDNYQISYDVIFFDKLPFLFRIFNIFLIKNVRKIISRFKENRYLERTRNNNQPKPTAFTKISETILEYIIVNFLLIKIYIKLLIFQLVFKP